MQSNRMSLSAVLSLLGMAPAAVDAAARREMYTLAAQRNRKRVGLQNPAGTKLVKKFCKASKAELPPYTQELKALAPKDRLLERWGMRA